MLKQEGDVLDVDREVFECKGEDGTTAKAEGGNMLCTFRKPFRGCQTRLHRSVFEVC